MTITYLSKAMHGDRDHPRYLNRLASTGVARTDVEVRVVDEADNDVALGEIGDHRAAITHEVGGVTAGCGVQRGVRPMEADHGDAENHHGGGQRPTNKTPAVHLD